MEKRKVGRPIKLDKPKDARLQLRLSQEDKEEIKKISSKLNMTTTDFFLYATKKLIEEMKEGE